MQEGISYLRKVDLPITLLFVVTKQGEDLIPRVIEFAESFGLQRLRLVPAETIGRNGGYHTLERHRFVAALSRHCVEYHGPLRLDTTAYPLLGDYIEAHSKLNSVRLSCAGGATDIYVAPNGRIGVCPFLHGRPLPIHAPTYDGMFPRVPLDEAWRSDHFEQFRELKKETVRAASHSKCAYSRSGNCSPCPLSSRSCLEVLREDGKLKATDA